MTPKSANTRRAVGEGDRSTSALPQARPERRWRRWLIRLAMVVLAPALFFLVLEGGLRLVRYGHATAFLVPAERPGVYMPNRDFALRFFAPGVARAPLGVRLAHPKPPGTFRIFLLGESAAMGIPDASFGPARILETMLNRRYPGTRFEVINAAITGINSHAILPIARQCAQFEPDLFVIYMGNNEVVGPFGPGTVFNRFSPHLGAIRASIWLKGLRSGQLIGQLASGLAARGSGGGDLGSEAPRVWRGMEMFAQNQVPADDPALPGMRAHFQQNLRDICAAATSAGAPVVLSTIAVNLKDNAPFASMHRSGLPAADLKRWNALYQQAAQFQDAQDHARAVELYEAALKIDDRHAELHFRLARSLLELARNAEAKIHFTQARDLDCLRFRTDSALNQIIRQFAEEQRARGVHLVDSEKAFEQNQSATGGIPGEELFFEHVHLRFEGNCALAGGFFQAIAPLLPPQVQQSSAAASRPVVPSPQQCAEALGFTDVGRRNQLAQMARLMARPPFTGQYNFHRQKQAMQQELAELGRRLTPQAKADAAALMQEASARRPEDPWLHHNLGHLQCQSGMVEAAASQFALALQALPDEPTILNWLGLALAAQRRFAEAEQCFHRILQIAPYNQEARTDLVKVLQQQGKFAEAIRLLDQAQQMMGEDVELHMLRTQLLLASGRSAEAESRCREAIARWPDHPGPRLVLGDILRGRGALREAAEQAEAVLKLDGASADAYVQLAYIAHRSGDDAQLIIHGRAALALNPQLPELNYAMGQAMLRQQQPAEAIRLFRQELAIQPGWSPAVTALAWLLATHPQDALRNGQEAVACVEPLAKRDAMEARALDVLAAAYAEAGRFAEAVATAGKAIDAAQARGSADLVARLQLRMASYRANRPWREQPAPR